MLSGNIHPLDTRLKNREEISAFCRQDWRVIQKLINEKEFPARKIGKSWESDVKLICEWQRKRITNACQNYEC